MADRLSMAAAMKGHGWTPLKQAQLLPVMANHITLNAPKGADWSWKY